MKKGGTYRLIRYCLLPVLVLIMLSGFGCEWKEKKGSTGSGSGSSSPSPPSLPPHEQAYVNILEMDVFSGQALNQAYWTWLEAYCKAGPTHLIIADMPLVPGHFTHSIAPGYWASQMYALSSTYAGVAWTPPEDPDAAYYYTIRDQIDAWWTGYIEGILTIMKKAPQTTAIIIINDYPDACGARLGVAIQNHLSPVGDRVALGEVLWYWR